MKYALHKACLDVVGAIQISSLNNLNLKAVAVE